MTLKEITRQKAITATLPTVLITSLLMMTSCNDLSGNMHVNNTFQLANNDGVQTLFAGDYQSTVAIVTENLLRLRIQTGFGQQEFDFSTSQNLKELKSGQRLEIPASENGQGVNLVAMYNSQTSRSAPVSTVESCTYSVIEYGCWEERTPQTCHTVEECNPANPRQCKTRTVCEGGELRKVCGNHRVTYSGRQDVVYDVTTTVDSVEFQIKNSDNSAALARMHGENTDSHKNYSQIGECR